MNSTKNKHVKAVKSHSSSESGNARKIPKNSLFGAIIGISVSFILILIGAFICYSADDYEPLILPSALIAIYLSGFIGGFCSAKKQRGYALICGALCGILMALFWLICSFALKENEQGATEFSKSFLPRLGIILSSIIGGYFGALKKQTRKHKR